MSNQDSPKLQSGLKGLYNLKNINYTLSLSEKYQQHMNISPQNMFTAWTYFSFQSETSKEISNSLGDKSSLAISKSS